MSAVGDLFKTTIYTTHPLWDLSTHLMAPTQHLFGNGKTYVVYSNKNHYSHVICSEKTSQIIKISQKIIGVLHTLFCIFNLMGLTIKGIIYIVSPRPFPCHFLRNQIKNNEPIISIVEMRKKLQKMAPTQEELIKIKKIKVTDLLKFLNTAFSEEDYLKEDNKQMVNHLKTWLKKDIFDSTKYTHIKTKNVPLAKKQLIQRLKLIIYHLRLSNLSNPEIIDLFKKLYFASIECTPTWLKVSKKIYESFKLKDSDSTSYLILKWVKEIIEDVLLEFVQLELGMHWNGLNQISNMLHRELGLDCSDLRFDSAYHLRFFFIFNAKYSLLFNKFYRLLTPKILVDRLIKKIEVKSKGTNQFVGLLSQSLVRHAKNHAKINNNSIDDEAIYALKHFFHKKPSTKQAPPKYSLNKAGAIALLKQQNILWNY